MNVLEAQDAIGYTMRASVLHDIRVGRLKVDRDGQITKESVEKRIRRRNRNSDPVLD